MSFSQVRDLLEKNFNACINNGTTLFTVELDKDKLWQVYLDSFPEGTNPVYRIRREHDCSCCRHFLKNIGPTVWIDNDLNVHTLFEFDTGSPDVFQPVMDALDAFVKQHPINGIYLSKDETVGCYSSHVLEDGKSVVFNHFALTLPKHLRAYGSSIGEKKGSYVSTKDVFKRSLDEISVEAIDTILELIQSNTLYRGNEWKTQLQKFREYKKAYDKLDNKKKDLFCWKNSAVAGSVIGHIKNHSIGVLLIDVSNDMDLDQAVRKYEAIVAPTNYKRPKAIFTKKMLEEAQKKVEELGLMDSLPRRYAVPDDITVNNILFANKDTAKKLAGNVFDEMKEETSINPKSFARVEEIPIDNFIADVLPTVSEMEVLMQNKLEPNLVSIIAPVNREAPGMFKWNNGFSWAYAGNMTDSDIRENVKNAGGKVDGVLRFSIQWNDLGEYDGNDEDAHCIEPGGNEIYYASKSNWHTGGSLDVDITHPTEGHAAVENITWPHKRDMEKGTYCFFVHCYANRGGKSGFRAEIEFDGNVYSFDYDKPLRHGEKVYVADVTLNDAGEFSITETLKSNTSSRETWGIRTNTFVQVSMMMYSPNYWDEQNGIGNKHYMFMLKGCVNPENPNGFYNEYLKHELEEHKRVFEALGSKMHVADDPNQLSGLGFCATRRNELIVRVKGNVQRIMKIKF